MRSLLPLLLCLSTAALASEFWLQPGSFRVAVGTAVPLRLLAGADFAGLPWPRPTRRVRRFVRLGPAGTADSTDLKAALLADSVAPALVCPTPGTHVVVLGSTPILVELPAVAFTAYLRAEGLDQALLYRRQQGQTAQPGREAYCRYAKTLVYATAGPHPPAYPADTVYRRVLGLPLELVPEQNPYHLRPGAALTVRVLRRGQPVAGALVHVWQTMPAATGQRPGSPTATSHFTARANNSGRALLRVPGNGTYLVTAMIIEAAPPELANRADWLSTWASLTFAGPPEPAGLSRSHFYK